MKNIKKTKIDQFINKQLITDELKNVIVVPSPDGSYELFDRYKITKSNSGFLVTFIKPFDQKFEFASMKNAVAWCTLDNDRRYRDANKILELDLKLSSNDLNMQIHKKLAKKAKSVESKLIYINKWEEESRKKRLMTAELEIFINKSRYIQNQKFDKTPSFKKL